MCNVSYFVKNLSGNKIYFQTSVFEGRRGLPLLDKPTISSGPVDAPGLTVSFSGSGNDLFLFWVAVCIGHENSQEPFSFLRGKY